MRYFEITGSFTDYYQITMAQAYFLEGKKDTRACFDYFYRKNPFDGGFVVFTGLGDLLNILKDFSFSDEDIRFLGEQKLNSEFLRYLKDFKFRGSIYAPKEGDLIFPVRPVLRVEGNIIECQIIETLLLNYLNFSSLISTKAARIRMVAGDRILSDFGLRRAQGAGGLLASKAAILGGFDSTSDVYAARIYHLNVSGTMAHSFIQSFDNELSAFRHYADAHPDKCILLLDTYDTLNSGLPNAIIIAKELEATGKRLLAVRLDSGDLAYLSKKTRKILNDEGLYDVKIVASNQLDEYLIKSLLDQGAEIDIFGVGTNLVTGSPDAALDGVYKLSVSENIPRLKLSESIGKVTLPGFKQVYRLLTDDNGFYGGEVVCLDEEKDPEFMIHPFESDKRLEIKKYPKEKILLKVMDFGKILIEDKEPDEIRKFVHTQINKLPEEYKRFHNPHEYKIGLSNGLYQLREKLRKKYAKS